MVTKKKDMYKHSNECSNMGKACVQCKWYDGAYSHCTLYSGAGRFIGKPKCANCGKPISKEAYETDASYCQKCAGVTIDA